MNTESTKMFYGIQTFEVCIPWTHSEIIWKLFSCVFFTLTGSTSIQLLPTISEIRCKVAKAAANDEVCSLKHFFYSLFLHLKIY